MELVTRVLVFYACMKLESLSKMSSEIKDLRSKFDIFLVTRKKIEKETLNKLDKNRRNKINYIGNNRAFVKNYSANYFLIKRLHFYFLAILAGNQLEVVFSYCCW